VKRTAELKGSETLKYTSKLKKGDRVWEVLIYTVRPAVVTGVARIKSDDGKKIFVYTIECDDRSLSPRYGEDDIGKVLFADKKEAEDKCREYRRIAAPFGAKGAYRKRLEQKHGERSLEMLCRLISGHRRDPFQLYRERRTLGSPGRKY